MGKINLLCDRLPEHITVGGERYGIYTDFRRWILLCEVFDGSLDGAFSDNIFGGFAAADCAAMLVCPALRQVIREKPSAAEEFIREIGSFALMGEEVKDRGSGSERRSVQLFDFEADGERIFSSFMSVYGIDLTEVNMHWWKFMALLRCLPRESPFMQVVELRGADTSSISDERVRRQIRRARAAVRIPKNTANTAHNE